MTRHAWRFAAIALFATLIAPTFSWAYFPPNIGMPPVTATNVPPDPFGFPDTGGLGEPEPTDPGTGPTVQTPEPETVVTALMGVAMAGAYGLRKRMRSSVAA